MLIASKEKKPMQFENILEVAAHALDKIPFIILEVVKILYSFICKENEQNFLWSKNPQISY